MHLSSKRPLPWRPDPRSRDRDFRIKRLEFAWKPCTRVVSTCCTWRERAAPGCSPVNLSLSATSQSLPPTSPPTSSDHLRLRTEMCGDRSSQRAPPQFTSIPEGSSECPFGFGSTQQRTGTSFLNWKAGPCWPPRVCSRGRAPSGSSFHHLCCFCTSCCSTAFHEKVLEADGA